MVYLYTYIYRYVYIYIMENTLLMKKAFTSVHPFKGLFLMNTFCRGPTKKSTERRFFFSTFSSLELIGFCKGTCSMKEK